MEETEREALYLAIQGFVGSHWDGRNLYPDPCGWTPIQGVSCDVFEGLWYVVVVNIGPVLDNSLECSQEAAFSPQLFELKRLRSLSFFRCFTSVNQTTTLSQDWRKLSGSLETLEFRSNDGLTGAIPVDLALLSNLQSLVLVENSLTGELPQELGNLLLILDLSGNSLSGSLPCSIGGMSSLLKLDLSNNHLNGDIPSELGKLKNLTLLDLRNNSLSGVTPSLGDMASLRYMLLSDNPLGGNLMQLGLRNLRSLTTLDLSNTGFVGGIPEYITDSRRLRFIALDNNNLTGSVPKKFQELSGLTALYLNDNNLTGELEFSDEFYRRMGSRFAAWNNPNLCCRFESSGRVLPGVQRCEN
ncbi:Leucine Rich Repeat [Musa troglodytarum]|uniref:Leucine Rich Repeat n=1 Tax=Musa troglodytarum TaxID=320322 RepID=A0A9E7KVH8_9LILI|nr:Leucine Rich Repeat [Musa troglodytarum]